MITLMSTFLQKILTLVLLTATRPEVYVATMTTVLSNSYDYLVDTLNRFQRRHRYHLFSLLPGSGRQKKSHIPLLIISSRH